MCGCGHTRNTVATEPMKEVIGEYEPSIGSAKRRKLQWFGHVSGRPGTLMHAVIAGVVGGRGRRGCPRRQWIDDVKSGQGCRWCSALEWLSTGVMAEEGEVRGVPQRPRSCGSNVTYDGCVHYLFLG